MKDAMEISTISTKACRVSKTSLKPWTLYGPIDQALKTSIQATSVRFHSLNLTVHGMDIALEMWVNAEPISETSESPNMPAITILAVQKLREQGKLAQAEVFDMGEVIVGVTSISHDDLVPVVGAVIVTGAGGADLPDIEDLGCVFAALMGQHD
jgi:hypothetical protein